MRHTGALASPPPDEAENASAFHKTEAFASASANDNASIDNTDLHTFRGPQAAGSCVEYSTCEQVNDMAAAQGTPLPELSPAHLYAHARLLASPAVPGLGLPDSGSQCRLAGQAARDVGMVAESVYPDVAANIAQIPPARVWQSGGVAKVTTAHRLLATSLDDLRTQLVTALVLARTGQVSMPSACIPVDDAYANLPANDVYSAQGALTWEGQPVAVRPNHCQIILAYDKDRDAFAFGSSWGGDRLYWISAALLYQIGLEFWVIGGFTRVTAEAA